MRILQALELGARGACAKLDVHTEAGGSHLAIGGRHRAKVRLVKLLDPYVFH